MDTEKKETRGGARPGAGRKPSVATHTTHVRLPVSVWDALQKIAKEEKAPVSDIIRQGVEAWIHQKEKNGLPEIPACHFLKKD